MKAMVRDDTDVGIIIIHYGRIELVEKLLESLVEHPDRRFIDHIVVVNNDDAGEELQNIAVEYEEHDFSYSYVNNDGTGYASAVNLGAAQLETDILLISNNDIEWVSNSSVVALINYLEEENIAVAGPQQIYPDGSWQRSYGKYPSINGLLGSIMMLDALANRISELRFRSGTLRPKQVEYVDGAFIAVRAATFDEVGGFDDTFNFYAEETDFCRRIANRGNICMFCPQSRVMHIRGASSSKQVDVEFEKKLYDAKCRFIRKHRSELEYQLYRKLYPLQMVTKLLIFSILNRLTSKTVWQHRTTKTRQVIWELLSIRKDSE